MNKISVIIPVFNVEKYLTKCLESIVNQTFKDIEIICIDDGSTDNSLKILNDYAQKDNRIKVISKPNGGLFSARHIGIETAKGEYILFVDSDDWIDTTLIEKAYKKITETNTDVVIFGAYTVKNNSSSNGMYSVNKIPKKFKNKILTLDDYKNNIFKFCPTAWSKLYRKDFIAVNNIRFQEIKQGEDQLFYIHTMLKAKSIYILDENLYYYVKNREGSLTNNSMKSSIAPIQNFFAAEKMLDDQNLSDNYIYQIINKYFSKSLSWYGKCTTDFKPEFYSDLINLKKHIDLNYPCGWWSYLNINNNDSYMKIKMKISVAKFKWQILKGK